MLISVKPSSNKMEFTGNIVADASVFATKNGEGARVRLAHNQGKDRKPIFMDVVMFSTKERAIPKDVLKKGRYVKVVGSYFEEENTGNDGKTYQNHGIKAYSIEEVKAVVMEVSEDGKSAVAVSSAEDEVEGDLPI